MSTSLNIEGIDRAKLIQELYNNTKALGMGQLHDLRGGMDSGTAEGVIKEMEAHAAKYNHPGVMHFDYVYGRPIKVTFNKDTLERADLYDRDAPGGLGTAERVVASLRKAAEPQKNY